MAWEEDSSKSEYDDALTWQEIVRPALEAVEKDTSWQVEGEDSRHVYKIMAFLTLCGVEVEVGPLDDPQIAGRAQYEPIEKVWICVPNARMAVLTAAHEAGHILSYWRLRKRFPNPPESEVRERNAFLYGWVVLRWLGIPIPKQEWIDFDLTE